MLLQNIVAGISDAKQGLGPTFEKDWLCEHKKLMVDHVAELRRELEKIEKFTFLDDLRQDDEREATWMRVGIVQLHDDQLEIAIAMNYKCLFQTGRTIDCIFGRSGTAIGASYSVARDFLGHLGTE